MPRTEPIGPADLARIEAAFAAGGLELTRTTNRRPWRYEGVDARDGQPLSIALYLWPLRRD